MKPWTLLSNLHGRDLLAQIEAVDALHGPHARLPRAHLRPALPPLLPHQRPRRRPLALARTARSTSRTLQRPAARRRRRAATGSRRSPRATTSGARPDAPRSCSPPRPAVTSACSPAAPRAARPGCCSTSSSTPRPPCKARQAAERRCLACYPQPMLARALTLLPALATARPPARPSPRPPPHAAPAAEPRIAPGVSAAGLDLANLTIPEATAKLEQTLRRPARRAARGRRSPGRRFGQPKRAEVAFDASATARRAYYAGQAPAGAPTAPLADRRRVAQGRAVRNSRGRSRARSTSRRATRRSASRSRRSCAARPHTGRALDAKALRERSRGRSPTRASRRLSSPAGAQVKPKVTADDLARAYPTVITIDRTNFKLRLFKRLQVLEDLRRRRRPAGLPDADRPLPRSRTSRSTRPGRRRTPRGPASSRARRCPAASRQPAEGALAGRRRRRRHPRHRRRSTRSARAPRTAASACASPTSSTFTRASRWARPS